METEYMGSYTIYIMKYKRFTVMGKDSDTFIKITNKDIYELIQIGTENNIKEHAEIMKHQLKTNGKVKLNRWIATTALMITLIIIGKLALI